MHRRATSTSATGPFTSTSLEPLVCQPELGGSIDPHPFVDTDGTAYLLWKADGNAIGRPSTLFSQRLRSDGLALDGQATPLLHNDAAWEAPLVENPALVRVGGRYVLLYSGGWWESAGYGTGYATCDGPLGPCAKVTTENPLHTGGGGVAGPGGASVITGPTGDLWLAHPRLDPGCGGLRIRRGPQPPLHIAPLGRDPAGRLPESADMTCLLDSRAPCSPGGRSCGAEARPRSPWLGDRPDQLLIRRRLPTAAGTAPGADGARARGA